MIDVLGLALYGPLAASTRYRLAQYVPGLAAQGIRLRIVSLLGDEYLRRRFAGERLPIGEMLKSGFERFRQLRNARSDLAILHCELFPLLPAWGERMLLTGLPYIYDFDDAFYEKYRRGRLKILRPMLGRKFESVVSRAVAVTAGNSTLAGYAARFNDEASIFPTVVDTERYVRGSSRESASPFVVGWIGSPSTAPYLREIGNALRRLRKQAPLKLLLIGGKAPKEIRGLDIEERPWSEAEEIELIQSFDVGIMPLPDDEWTRGKCAFKLIQYMACGIPVVGSRVGANRDVVTPDCGFLVRDDDGWMEAIGTLRDNPQLRNRMGTAARQRVVSHYSLQRNLPVLADIIRGAHARRGYAKVRSSR